MLSHSVKAKRRRNKTYHELVRKIEIRRIDRTTTGNHYLISLTSPSQKNFAHHLEVAGEAKIPKFYSIMLELARQEAHNFDVQEKFKKNYEKNHRKFMGVQGLRPGELVTMSAHSNSRHKTMFGHWKAVDQIVAGSPADRLMKEVAEAIPTPTPLMVKAMNTLKGGEPLTTHELSELVGNPGGMIKSTIGLVADSTLPLPNFEFAEDIVKDFVPLIDGISQSK